jgi:cell division protein FtsB
MSMQQQREIEDLKREIAALKARIEALEVRKTLTLPKKTNG